MFRDHRALLALTFALVVFGGVSARFAQEATAQRRPRPSGSTQSAVLWTSVPNPVIRGDKDGRRDDSRSRTCRPALSPVDDSKILWRKWQPGERRQAVCQTAANARTRWARWICRTPVKDEYGEQQLKFSDQNGDHQAEGRAEERRGSDQAAAICDPAEKGSMARPGVAAGAACSAARAPARTAETNPGLAGLRRTAEALRARANRARDRRSTALRDDPELDFPADRDALAQPGAASTFSMYSPGSSPTTESSRCGRRRRSPRRVHCSTAGTRASDRAPVVRPERRRDVHCVRRLPRVVVDLGHQREFLAGPELEGNRRRARQGPPTVSREFRTGEELALMAEVYDNAGQTPHTVDITTSLRSDDGRVVYSHEDQGEQ